MDGIEIVAYRSEWPAMFDQEAARLRTLLARELILDLRHIGSTAVPGLAAKPVIDMMATTPDLTVARARLVEPLETDGYAFWADNPAPDRLFFVRGLPPAAPHRTHHLHIVSDTEVLNRHLRFRDRLRRDLETRSQYAALKRDLAAKHAGDRDAYTSAKGDWIAERSAAGDG